MILELNTKAKKRAEEARSQKEDRMKQWDTLYEAQMTYHQYFHKYMAEVMKQKVEKESSKDFF